MQRGAYSYTTMARRNPLLFKRDEYNFLHKVYLPEVKRTKMYKEISEKRGMGLDETQINFVKEKCAEFKEKNPNALLWMK
jgi:hypothetical protein